MRLPQVAYLRTIWRHLVALRKRAGSLGKQRDTISHNIWAVQEALPESLVLLDARQFSVFVASQRAMEHGTGDRTRHEEHFDEILNGAREYREKDFLDMERDLKALYMDLSRFENKLVEQNQAPKRRAP